MKFKKLKDLHVCAKSGNTDEKKRKESMGEIWMESNVNLLYGEEF